MNPIEKMILRQLLGDQEFAERVVPYLKERYFFSLEAGIIHRVFDQFFQKFKKIPAFSLLRIGIEQITSLTEEQLKNVRAAVDAIENEPLLDETQRPAVLEQTEDYVQERAIYCALQDAIKLVDDPKKTKHAIPDLMKEALAVSFDSHVGHDFFADAAARYAFYHKPESRIPFDLDTFNKLTRGGTPKKTLNVVLAGTNVGKSLALCHMSAAWLAMSKNVLYITCEMAEERIAERIDANLFDLPLDDIEQLPEIDYQRKISQLRSTSTGRLIIKEYPTATAHAGDFRSLLLELRLKQNFAPDVIVVDYLSICASSRVKLNHQSVNSYAYNKFIAEELRGLAVEFDVPVWTAAQFNREGFKSSDPGLEHVGESFGIPQTADFTVALVTTDELDKLGQISLIELKNRYNKKRSFQTHLLGVDSTRMKLYELSAAQVAQSLTLPTSAPAPSPSGQKPPLSAFRKGTRRKPLGSLKKENENNEAT